MQRHTKTKMVIVITHGFVSSKIYNKRKAFNFDIVNSHFWMATYLVPFLIVFTFVNLLGLQECLVICLTSMLVSKI